MEHSAKTHPDRRRRRWSRRARVAAGVGGALLAGTAAFAATNWAVSLGSGSSGEAQSGSVANITITAVAVPSATNLLYPGGNGDVVVSIVNPNAFPVTITGVDLPASTSYAAGFSNSSLTTAQTGCSATTSLVGWTYATATSGSVHTLNTPLTVAAGNSASPLLVTLTNDATMGLLAPPACEATYFSMPSLTGVVATAGTGTATTSPATDYWNS